MNIGMWKFIKRTVQLIAALIVVGIVAWVGYENSARLATDIAFLSCPVTDAERLNVVDTNFREPMKNRDREEKPYTRLQKDWIRGEIILNWIADVSESEDGLQGAKRLKESVTEYSGYDWGHKANRSINRETLIYRLEVEDNYWVERQCVPISKQEFNKAVDAVTTATKAKQKI
ncbi:hypothetical protein OAZ20_03750 [Paracoccaceae bacterium]|nr:hypothetical protein [Paracoccaceae bacterium]